MASHLERTVATNKNVSWWLLFSRSFFFFSLSLVAKLVGGHHRCRTCDRQSNRRSDSAARKTIRDWLLDNFRATEIGGEEGGKWCSCNGSQPSPAFAIHTQWNYWFAHAAATASAAYECRYITSRKRVTKYKMWKDSYCVLVILK